MYSDIVIPNNNETQFLEMAKRLGFSSICFLYPLKDFKVLVEEPLDIKVYYGVIAGEKEVKKARQKADLVLVDNGVCSDFDGSKISTSTTKSNNRVSSSDENIKDDGKVSNLGHKINYTSNMVSKSNKNDVNIRRCVEKERPDIILSIENDKRKDFIHQRNSGLDHIIAKISARNNICFGFPLARIIEARDKPQVLGRLMQNLRLVSKYDTGFVMGSFASNPYSMRAVNDIISFFSVLGADKKAIKNALQKIPCIVERNSKLRKGTLSEGVEIVED